MAKEIKSPRTPFNSGRTESRVLVNGHWVRRGLSMLASELLSAGYLVAGPVARRAAQRVEAQEETVWERTITLLPEVAVN